MTKAAAVMVCGGEKKLFLRFLNFDSWRGGRLSGRPFCSRRIPRVGEQSYFAIYVHIVLQDVSLYSTVLDANRVFLPLT